MARPTKIGLAVRIKETAKTGSVSYPRYEVVFRNGRASGCRRTAESKPIPIPADASFYLLHPKNDAGDRVTPLGR